MRLPSSTSLSLWSGISQAASAGSNIVVELTIALFLGVVGLGEWALRYAVIVTVLYLVRAAIGDVLLADTAPTQETPDGRIAPLLGLVLALGGVAALVVALAAAATHDLSWLAVAVVIPGALLQDALRYVGFWSLEPKKSALLDLTWLVVSLLGIAVLSGSRSVTTGVLVWGIGATVGALIGLLSFRVLPGSPRPALTWWWSHRRLAVPTSMDTALYLAGNQGLWFLVAALAGTQVLGTFRLALLIANPSLLAYLAAQTMLVPALSRRVVSPRRILGLAGLCALAGLAILAVTLILVLPLLRSAGIAEGATSAALILATIVYVAVSGPYVIAASVLRARRRGLSFLSMRAASTLVAVAFSAIWVSRYGATGTMSAMACGVGSAIVVGLVILRRQRQSGHQPAPQR